ncbi:sulfotransferase domain-containing protein [Bacteroidota bacterium]
MKVSDRFRYFKGRLKRQFLHSSATPRIYIFSYHKVGTKLLAKIYQEICWQWGWNFKNIPGTVKDILSEIDVAVLLHSQVRVEGLSQPFKGVHLIRDPRDILISGYLYHMRTTEEWCINEEFHTGDTISYPQVPYSQEHRSEEWKVSYLNGLNGKSYQNNLKALGQKDGILFEMERYADWTISEMAKWNYNDPRVLELKFEDLMSDMHSVSKTMLEFSELDEKQVALGLKIADRENILKKSEAEIDKHTHISSKNTTKWREYFDEDIKKAFIQRFGTILIDLGYEKNHNW